MTTDVSVLGLGAMGRALAAALATEPRSVTVWNRTPGRAVGLDVTPADDVPAAVAASPVVIVCLLDYTIVQGRLAEAAGALPGRTVVNLTNGTPRQARELAAWCRDRGARYVDGAIMAVPPIIGTPHARLLLSGDEGAAAEAGTLLARLGRTRFVGTDDGLASLWDLALLSGMYGLFGGFAHAAALLGSEGVDAADVLAPFQDWIAAMTPSLARMAERIDSGRYDQGVASPLSMQAHAMPHLVDAAVEQGVRPDLMSGVAAVVQETVARGHGESDFAAVIEVLRRTERPVPAVPSA